MRELMPLLWAIFYTVLGLIGLGVVVQVYLIVQARKAAKKVQDQVLGAFPNRKEAFDHPFFHGFLNGR